MKFHSVHPERITKKFVCVLFHNSGLIWKWEIFIALYTHNNN